MKQIASIVTNVLFTAGEDDVLMANVELIVVASEPEYGFSALGPEKHMRTTTYRFHASTEALRQIAATLIKHADDADALLVAAVKKLEEA